MARTQVPDVDPAQKYWDADFHSQTMDSSHGNNGCTNEHCKQVQRITE